ncbi:PspA/IM30 family protein [Metabacillus sediminilitoris]|uniref:PspA/IM30 family protein n=1 Tax=Metabacillus sediminilitoris TaxID=2567941 RepID=A0A4S4BWU7_9BACI|nr:PspA/IM30 family protein [Metabacillus sediminilitoris]QGQ45993.1 PspA/IM30 family protein [Metabacillus sediminilitoris]THF79677.1 PspA/IM30 family protein [Metabacillus sediminilitoris]
MGIFNRIKTIARADINSLLDGLEDPIAMLNEFSREMEQEMAKAQTALSRQIFVENKQAVLVLDTKNILAKRTRQAKLAIEMGEDAIAKLAVQEKLNHEKQLSIYQQQYEAIQGQTQLLKEKLIELQEIYSELQHKKMLLASRANVAQSIKQIQKATGSFQTDNIVRGVARAEERILLIEAEVQAGSQFANPLAQHDAAYRNYVNEEELNREIDKLKSEKESESKAG